MMFYVKYYFPNFLEKELSKVCINFVVLNGNNILTKSSDLSDSDEIDITARFEY